MVKLTVRRDAYKRKAYKRKDGTMVKAALVGASTFQVKDRGEKGRTPKSRQWYSPQVKSGWEKQMPASKRRMLVLRAHKNDLLAAGRGMQALANVSTDKPTYRAAEMDSTYFFRKYAEKIGRKSKAKTAR